MTKRGPTPPIISRFVSAHVVAFAIVVVVVGVPGKSGNIGHRHFGVSKAVGRDTKYRNAQTLVLR